jgi:hypothetical protein
MDVGVRGVIVGIGVSQIIVQDVFSIRDYKKYK